MLRICRSQVVHPLIVCCLSFPVLINALKEQQSEIDELKKQDVKIKEQDGKMKEQEKRLERLEAIISNMDK